MNSLQKKIDALPKQAVWEERKISLIDDPGEEHLIQYRNPLDAVKALWGDPNHANDLVYSPVKVYTDEEHQDHLYNEMWTAKWWWKVQVCYCHNL